MRAEFSDNLITGNELIDSQHKELIDRINKLLDSCEENNARRRICRRMSVIRDTPSTKRSMTASKRRSKSCTRCFRKRKARLPLLLKRSRKM